MWRGTLTGYLVGVLVVLAILNGIAWWRDATRAHDFAVFSAGFLLAAFGMYLSAYINGYRRTAMPAMPRRTFAIVAALTLILIGGYSYFLDFLSNIGRIAAKSLSPVGEASEGRKVPNERRLAVSSGSNGHPPRSVAGQRKKTPALRQRPLQTRVEMPSGKINLTIAAAGGPIAYVWISDGPAIKGNPYGRGKQTYA